MLIHRRRKAPPPNIQKVEVELPQKIMMEYDIMFLTSSYNASFCYFLLCFVLFFVCIFQGFFPPQLESS